MKNTVEKGTVTIFSYFDTQENTFIGVCLEFNIVLTGNHPFAVTHEVLEMAKSHIETVRDHNLPDELLNRHAPKKYWDLFDKLRGVKDRTDGSIFQSPYSKEEFSSMLYAC